MAAPTLNLSRLGQINGAGGDWAKDNALFLKVFSGEVLTAFKRACNFKGTTQDMTISSGKEAQFPVTGRFGAYYHVPGDMIIGQGNMAQNEVTIRIDDLLIAPATIYELDALKDHVDKRQIYSTELGEALARAYDKRIARVLALAARQTTSDLTANLPVGLSPDDPFRTGTIVDLNKAAPTPDDLVAAVFAAAQALDEKDVSAENRVLACSPEIYYSLIQSSRAINMEFNTPGSNGGYAGGTISRLAGFNIFTSNHIKQGNVTAAAGEQGQTWNGASVLSTIDMTKTKMLAYQRGAVGVLKLKDLSMSMTGNDYDVMYSATLMKASYALGFGYLRPEAVVEISNSL